jgi:hypothetical protein
MRRQDAALKPSRDWGGRDLGSLWGVFLVLVSGDVGAFQIGRGDVVARADTIHVGFLTASIMAASRSTGSLMTRNRHTGGRSARHDNPLNLNLLFLGFLCPSARSFLSHWGSNWGTAGRTLEKLSMELAI